MKQKKKFEDDVDIGWRSHESETGSAVGSSFSGQVAGAPPARLLAALRKPLFSPLALRLVFYLQYCLSSRPPPPLLFDRIFLFVFTTTLSPIRVYVFVRKKKYVFCLLYESLY